MAISHERRASDAVTAVCFFFNDTATTEIYTLSLHDALPISLRERVRPVGLGLELGLRTREFGLEFDLAALEGPVCRMQRFLEPVERLVPLRNLAVAGLN